MGTVFLTNLAGRKVIMIWHFVHHIGFQDPQLFTFKKKLQLLKTLKKTLFISVLLFVSRHRCCWVSYSTHAFLPFCKPNLEHNGCQLAKFQPLYYQASLLFYPGYQEPHATKTISLVSMGPGKYNPNIMTVKNPLPTNFKHLLVSLFFCTLHRFFEKSQITLRCFVITFHYMFLS